MMINRTKKYWRKILHPIHLMTFHSLCASHCVPASGQPASMWSWHARSDQRGQHRTVLFKDKGTHLWGFAAKRRLFAWTKPRRGAQATVASDSVMASFRGGKGMGRAMARCQANITHTFANRNLHTVSRRFRMPLVFLAVASPQGRDPNHRWHHAKRKLGGIHKCHQRLYKTEVNAETK